MHSRREPTGWELGLGVTTFMLGGVLLLTNVVNHWSSEARKTDRALEFQRAKQILAHAKTDTARYQEITTGPDSTVTHDKAIVHYHLTSDELVKMGVQMPPEHLSNPQP